MSLVLTPAASADSHMMNLRNPLARSKGQSKVIFDEALTRRMSYLGATRVGVSRDARLMLGRKDRSIGIWRVLEDELGWEKLLEMDLRVG